MDLIDVGSVVRPRTRGEVPRWKQGDAILAGGTWMFSEPQRGVRRLIDLSALDWPPVEFLADGLRVAATCPLRALEAVEFPSQWLAGFLLAGAAAALAGSFKVTGSATVGGNLCLALPAAPVAALAVALDAVCEIWTENGGERRVRAQDFSLSEGRVALRPGDILRALLISGTTLRRSAAMRRASLVPYGRSAALLIGTRDADTFALTIAAAVGAPVRLDFAHLPDGALLAASIDAAIPEDAWWDDVHGQPAWRRHMTRHLAEEIRCALAAA